MRDCPHEDCPCKRCVYSRAYGDDCACLLDERPDCGPEVEWPALIWESDCLAFEEEDLDA